MRYTQLLIAAILQIYTSLNASIEAQANNSRYERTDSIAVAIETDDNPITSHINIRNQDTVTDTDFDNSMMFAFLVNSLYSFEKQYPILSKRFGVTTLSDAITCLYGLQLVTETFSQTENDHTRSNNTPAQKLHTFWHALLLYSEKTLTTEEQYAAKQWEEYAQKSCDTLTRFVYQQLVEKKVDLNRVQCTIADMLKSKLKNLTRQPTIAITEALEKVEKMQLQHISVIAQKLVEQKSLAEIHPSQEVIQNIGTIKHSWDTLYAFYTQELIDTKETITLAWYLFYLARYLQAARNNKADEEQHFKEKLLHLFDALTQPETTSWKVNRKINGVNQSAEIEISHVHYARLLHLLSLLLIQEICAPRSASEILCLKIMLSELVQALNKVADTEIVTGEEILRVRFVRDVVKILCTDAAHAGYARLRDNREHPESRSLMQKAGAHDIRKYCYCALRVGLRYPSTLPSTSTLFTVDPAEEKETMPMPIAHMSLRSDETNDITAAQNETEDDDANMPMETLAEEKENIPMPIAHMSLRSDETNDTTAAHNETEDNAANIPMETLAEEKENIPMPIAHMSLRSDETNDTTAAHNETEDNAANIPMETTIDTDQAMYSSSAAMMHTTARAPRATSLSYSRYKFIPQYIALMLSQLHQNELSTSQQNKYGHDFTQSLWSSHAHRQRTIAATYLPLKNKQQKELSSGAPQNKDQNKKNANGILCSSAEIAQEHSYYTYNSQYEYKNIWYWLFLLLISMIFAMLFFSITIYNVVIRIHHSAYCILSSGVEHAYKKRYDCLSI